MTQMHKCNEMRDTLLKCNKMSFYAFGGITRVARESRKKLDLHQVLCKTEPQNNILQNHHSLVKLYGLRIRRPYTVPALFSQLDIPSNSGLVRPTVR